MVKVYPLHGSLSVWISHCGEKKRTRMVKKKNEDRLLPLERKIELRMDTDLPQILSILYAFLYIARYYM